MKNWKEVLLEIVTEVGAITAFLFMFASGLWLILNTIK